MIATWDEAKQTTDYINGNSQDRYNLRKRYIEYVRKEGISVSPKQEKDFLSQGYEDEKKNVADAVTTSKNIQINQKLEESSPIINFFKYFNDENIQKSMRAFSDKNIINFVKAVGPVIYKKITENSDAPPFDDYQLKYLRQKLTYEKKGLSPEEIAFAKKYHIKPIPTHTEENRQNKIRIQKASPRDIVDLSPEGAKNLIRKAWENSVPGMITGMAMNNPEENQPVFNIQNDVVRGFAKGIYGFLNFLPNLPFLALAKKAGINSSGGQFASLTALEEILRRYRHGGKSFYELKTDKERQAYVESLIDPAKNIAKSYVMGEVIEGFNRGRTKVINDITNKSQEGSALKAVKDKYPNLNKDEVTEILNKRSSEDVSSIINREVAKTGKIRAGEIKKIIEDATVPAMKKAAWQARALTAASIPVEIATLAGTSAAMGDEINIESLGSYAGMIFTGKLLMEGVPTTLGKTLEAGKWAINKSEEARIKSAERKRAYKEAEAQSTMQESSNKANSIPGTTIFGVKPIDAHEKNWEVAQQLHLLAEVRANEGKDANAVKTLRYAADTIANSKMEINRDNVRKYMYVGPKTSKIIKEFFDTGKIKEIEAKDLSKDPLDNKRLKQIRDVTGLSISEANKLASTNEGRIELLQKEELALRKISERESKTKFLLEKEARENPKKINAGKLKWSGNSWTYTEGKSITEVSRNGDVWEVKVGNRKAKEFRSIKDALDSANKSIYENTRKLKGTDKETIIRKEMAKQIKKIRDEDVLSKDQMQAITNIAKGDESVFDRIPKIFKSKLKESKLEDKDRTFDVYAEGKKIVSNTTKSDADMMAGFYKKDGVSYEIKETTPKDIYYKIGKNKIKPEDLQDYIIDRADEIGVHLDKIREIANDNEPYIPLKMVDYLKRTNESIDGFIEDQLNIDPQLIDWEHLPKEFQLEIKNLMKNNLTPQLSLIKYMTPEQFGNFQKSITRMPDELVPFKEKMDLHDRANIEWARATKENGDLEERLEDQLMVAESVKKYAEDEYVPSLKAGYLDPDLVYDIDSPGMKTRNTIISYMVDTYIKSFGDAVADASYPGQKIVALRRLWEDHRATIAGNIQADIDKMFKGTSKKIRFWAGRTIDDKFSFEHAVKNHENDSWSYSKLTSEELKQVEKLASELRVQTENMKQLLIKHNVTGEDGRPIKFLKNYFHRIIKWGELDKESGKRKFFKYLKENKLINPQKIDADGHLMFKDGEPVMRTPEDINIECQRIYGKFLQEPNDRRFSFQNERKFKQMPEFAIETDPRKVFINLAEKVAEKCADFKYYGPKDKNLYDLLEQVRTYLDNNKVNPETIEYEWKRARRLVKVLTWEDDINAEASKWGRRWLNFNSMIFMGLSALSQVPQAGVGIAAGGGINWLKAIREIALHHSDARDFYLRSGSGMQAIQDDLLRFSLGGTRFTDKFLTYNLFKTTDNISRFVANQTGMFYMGYAQDEINKALEGTERIGTLEDGHMKYEYLKSKRKTKAIIDKFIEVDFNIKKALDNAKDGKVVFSQADKLAFARKFEISTNYRAHAIDLPEGYTNSMISRIIWQFGSYAYSRARELNRGILKQARRGNFKPFVKMLGTGVIAGGIQREVRNAILYPAGDEDGKYLTKELRNAIHEWANGNYFSAPTLEWFIESVAASGYIGKFEDANSLIYTGLELTGHDVGYKGLSRYSELPLGPTASMVTDVIKNMHNFLTRKNDKYVPIMNIFVGLTPGVSIFRYPIRRELQKKVRKKRKNYGRYRGYGGGYRSY